MENPILHRETRSTEAKQLKNHRRGELFLTLMLKNTPQG